MCKAWNPRDDISMCKHKMADISIKEHGKYCNLIILTYGISSNKNQSYNLKRMKSSWILPKNRITQSRSKDKISFKKKTKRLQFNPVCRFRCVIVKKKKIKEIFIPCSVKLIY